MAMNDNETIIIIKKYFLISILNFHFEPADLVTAPQTSSALICFSWHYFFFPWVLEDLFAKTNGGIEMSVI